jgi:redox-sensitive bicupin YhaK (pirin superfamily)
MVSARDRVHHRRVIDPSRRSFLAASLAAPVAAVGCIADRPASARVTPRTRAVARLVDAQPTLEGAGVHLRRTLGSSALPMLDPFLLLDEVHSDRAEDYLPGFPTHPHRGFETVTYVLDGAFEHRDSLGNHGRLTPGSAQWMTAGRGIVHSEMPGQTAGGMWMFQFWVNLPRASKMTAPRYQDIAPERVVEARVDDARVRLVAGSLAGRTGPVEGVVTGPQMLDLRFEGRGRCALPVAPDHNAFVYVIEGRVKLGADEAAARAGQLAVLGPGDRVTAKADGPARALLVSARPIGEPVARGGPFVMNTDDEIRQAWDDYRAGRLVTP